MFRKRIGVLNLSALFHVEHGFFDEAPMLLGSVCDHQEVHCVAGKPVFIFIVAIDRGIPAVCRMRL